MAEVRKKDNTKYWLIGGALIGTFFGIRYVYKSMKGDPGSTRRVKFDMEATQKRPMSTGAVDEEGNPVFHWIDSPWHPQDLADSLYAVMNGLNTPAWGDTERSDLWQKVGQLGIDRSRWLHNYWLDNLDSEDTLWRWIDQEIVYDYTIEADKWRRSKDMLRRASVGW